MGSSRLFWRSIPEFCPLVRIQKDPLGIELVLDATPGLC